jgi:hypothetical protein
MTDRISCRRADRLSSVLKLAQTEVCATGAAVKVASAKRMGARRVA